MFYDIYCELCQKHGLTPSGAATKIGFNRASVTMWKNTGKAPKQDLLIRIADYFGVSVDYLLGKEKAPTPTQIEDAKLRMLEEFGIGEKIHSSKRLAFLLEQFEMDTHTFSVCYGVDELQIYNWVHSQRMPDDATLGKVMDALNLNMFSFLSLKEQEYYRSRQDLSQELKEKAPIEDSSHEICLQDVDIGFYGEFMELSEDDKETVRDMVRVMRERRNKKG